MASSRSTSSSSRAASTVRRDLVDRRRRGSVAQLGERELGVEHEVRVAQAQRDLDELEVVEVGGAGQLVGLVGVARLVGLSASATSARATRHLVPAALELIAAPAARRRGGASTATRSATAEGRAARAHRSAASALSRSATIGVDLRLDLGGRLAGLHLARRPLADGVLELLLELLVLLERALDLLEVLQVGLGDLLLGAGLVAALVRRQRRGERLRVSPASFKATAELAGFCSLELLESLPQARSASEATIVTAPERTCLTGM